MCAVAITAVSGCHLNVPGISLACAAGVLTVTQHAPIWAGIFGWELAPPWWMLAVFLAAALAAHGLRLLSERYLRPRGADPRTNAPTASDMLFMAQPVATIGPVVLTLCSRHGGAD